MFGFLKNLFKDPTADWKRLVSDPLLGQLRLNEDATWWDAKTARGERTINFCIGGVGQPDRALLAHAHEIIRNFPQFEDTIHAFAVAEPARVSSLREYDREIQQLQISSINLYWPDRPNAGMIEFSGPDPYRLWRCDYIDRKPVGLGFDD